MGLELVAVVVGTVFAGVNVVVVGTVFTVIVVGTVLVVVTVVVVGTVFVVIGVVIGGTVVEGLVVVEVEVVVKGFKVVVDVDAGVKANTKVGITGFVVEFAAVTPVFVILDVIAAPVVFDDP